MKRSATSSESNDSTLFEKMVARIHSILESSKSCVTWNDKITDPDNPKRTRQIDVTIRTGDFLTMVECRIHKKRQDVKWIEELMGRKVSLNADALIAVSSSGFTEGAIIKANKYGIITRDFLSLTEEEIKRWGSISKVALNYLRFDNPTLILRLKPGVKNVQSSQHEMGGIFYNVAHTVAKELFDKIPENKQQPINCGIGAKKLKPNALDIEYVTLKASVVKTVKRLDMVSILAYGLDSEERLSRSVYVENFSEVSSIEHVGDNNIMVMDFSQIKQPPNTIYLSTEVTLQNLKKVMDEIPLVQLGGFNPNLILDYAVKFERC